MSTIIRTWKRAHPDTLWSIWDAGSEFWELKNGHLRHFSVIERSKQGEVIIEKVQLLQESPTPLEVVRQTILGWEVTEVEEPEAVRPLQQMLRPRESAQEQQEVQAPAKAQLRGQGQGRVQAQGQGQGQGRVQAQGQGQGRVQREAEQPRKLAFPPLTQGPAFLPDTPEDASEHPPPNLQSQQSAFAYIPKRNEVGEVLEDTQHEEHIGQEDVCSQSLKSQEGLSVQQPYNAPTELWSALSQWIPPNALFQPSLHHQAFLELSGTQEKSYPGKKDSESTVRQKEARRPYVAPARNSRPYQPKTFVQQGQGPLFI
jgi:hypothetical protein